MTDAEVIRYVDKHGTLWGAPCSDDEARRALERLRMDGLIYRRKNRLCATNAGKEFLCVATTKIECLDGQTMSAVSMEGKMQDFIPALAEHLGVDRCEALRRFRAWAWDSGMETPIDMVVLAFSIKWFSVMPDLHDIVS